MINSTHGFLLRMKFVNTLGVATFQQTFTTWPYSHVVVKFICHIAAQIKEQSQMQQIIQKKQRVSTLVLIWLLVVQFKYRQEGTCKTGPLFSAVILEWELKRKSSLYKSSFGTWKVMLMEMEKLQFLNNCKRFKVQTIFHTSLFQAIYAKIQKLPKQIRELTQSF